MTAAKSDLRKYMDSTQSLPADALLGWIVIYRIKDSHYDRTVLEKAFDDLSLSSSFLPAPNNPLHAYLKATSSVDDTTYPLPGGQVAHILMRDVREDKHMVARQLTREIRDDKRGHLGYTKVGECVFYRPGNTGGKVAYGSERLRLSVDHAALTEHEWPAMDTVLKKVATEYARFVNFVDGMKYRAVVRDYLVFLNALKIKDGFYFVHSSRHDDLVKLEGLVATMGGGSSLFILPLVDLGAQRQMVIDAFQTETAKALQEVVAKIATVRSTRKTITPTAYAQLKGEYETAVNRSKEYARTLKIQQISSVGVQEAAQAALVQLQFDMLDGAGQPVTAPAPAGQVAS